MLEYLFMEMDWLDSGQPEEVMHLLDDAWDAMTADDIKIINTRKELKIWIKKLRECETQIFLRRFLVAEGVSCNLT